MTGSLCLVTKRDGRKVPFDHAKITNAIHNANCTLINPVDADVLSEFINNEVIDTVIGTVEELSVENIQDCVEKLLMERFPEIALVYIRYRENRHQAREIKQDIYSEILSLVKQDEIEASRENANKDANVIPTQRDLVAGIVSKHIARRFLLDKDIVEAHDKGVIHFHDMDYSPLFAQFNCMLIDLEEMLTNGFKMGNAEIEQPRSISTAAAVTSQIIAQVASHIYGGNTIHEIDRVLAPYVTKTHIRHFQTAKSYEMDDAKAKKYADEQTAKDTYDAMQGLEYEVNTLHTANGQTPFCTFGFGRETSWEAKLIQKCILEVRLKGLGKNKITPVFPKLVFAMEAGINRNPEDPNYDIKELAVKCAAKRLYPDILNVEHNVSITGGFKSPMGCRSFLSEYVDESGKRITAGRNNLGVISLNLPRIARESGGDVGTFEGILNERLELCKRALWARINRFKGVKASVAPILYCEGALGIRLNPEDEVMQVFKDGRATISLGYIGLHETAEILFSHTKNHTIDSKEKTEFLVRIMDIMHTATDEWTAESGFAFGLYGTPAESLCYRFCRLDNKEFGTEHCTEKGYYTNSYHLDVEKKVTPFEKLKFESQFIPFTTGGHISYVEYPDMQRNLKGLESVWDYAFSVGIPYLGTNTPSDQCFKCGFEGEFTSTAKGFECPQCGNREEGTISVIRRVCGYLGQPNARPYNDGKQSEVIRRVKHC